MSKLGIIAALPDEARCLANIVRSNDDVILKVSGIGSSHARLAAEALLREGASALLSWGCCGALDQRTSPGDLMLPERIIGLNSDDESLCVHVDWHQRLSHDLSPHITIHTNAIAGSESILSTKAMKQTLQSVTGAIAVDMESATLADVARCADVPFMVIRVIADDVDTVFPPQLSHLIDDMGRVAFRQGALLLLQPWYWPALYRLYRQFNTATQTLKKIAELAAPRLLAP